MTLAMLPPVASPNIAEDEERDDEGNQIAHEGEAGNVKDHESCAARLCAHDDRTGGNEEADAQYPKG